MSNTRTGLPLELGGPLCPGGATCCFIATTPGDWGCGDQPNAGEVTLRNGDQLVVDAQYGTWYGPYSYGPGLYSVEPPVAPGDVVTLSAAGGLDVPHFSANLTIPDDTPLLTPVPTDGGYTLPTDRDLVMTWPPGPTPGPSYQFSITLFATQFAKVVCYPDDRTGTVTIPAALLQQLRDSIGGTTDSGILRLVRDSETFPAIPNLSLDFAYTYIFQGEYAPLY